MLADWRTAPIDERLRATLGYLQKATLAPSELRAADAEAVRAAGVSDEALRHALYVCFHFNLIDRIADSLGFDLPSQEEHRAYAPQFLAEGYGNET